MCRTNSGPDPLKPCIFPFTTWETRFPEPYTKYDACALDYTGKAWCPTEVIPKKFDNGTPYDYFFFFKDNSSPRYPNRKWGYCADDCPITNPPEGYAS